MEMHFCTYCGEVIYPEDLAPVKIPSELTGHFDRYFLHNRNKNDCLATMLDNLSRLYAAPQN
jgi:hypothetical protein